MNFAQQPQVQAPIAVPPQYGTSVLPIDGQLVSISLSAPHTVTGSNASGAVYRRVGLAGSWQQVPAPPGVVRISVADDGTTFATTNLEQICRFVNNAWQQVAGQAKTVAAGNAAAVFCANAAGQIWRFEPMSGQWVPVAAPFQATDISVGKDGTLYAVDAADGIHRFEPMTGAWTTIPGQLTQISVHDASCVVGVNRSGHVYQLNAATSTWTHLAQINGAARVAASADGIYVVGVDQSIKFVSAVAPIVQQGAMMMGAMLGGLASAFGQAQQPFVQQAQPQPVVQFGQPFAQAQPVVQFGQPFAQAQPVVQFGQPVGGAPPTVFAQPAMSTCKKCAGKGGLGTFGPVEAGHMHWKQACNVCSGSKVSALQHSCQMCHSKGALDTWGKPCEIAPRHMHFKAACPACNGVGFTAHQQTQCAACHGHGGFDTWAKPANVASMHYKTPCASCQGRAYI
jgi:hypothetical protein